MKPSIREESFSVVQEAARKTMWNIAGNGDNPNGLAMGLSIADRQKLEQQGILENYEAEKSQILMESTEKQWELLTDQARKLLYENLGIETNLENNSWAKKFLKGIVDGAILGNMEFIEMVVRDPMKAIETFKSLLSVEGLKKALQAIGKSLYDLVSGEPYDTGKSIGEIGLVATGAGIAVGAAKKGFKAIAKQEMKTALKTWLEAGGKTSTKTVLANAALSNTERLAKAEEILGRKLSKGEQSAILKAHEAGKNSVYEYTKPELRAKAEILKNEGNLSKAERETLMREWIAGKPRAAPEWLGSILQYAWKTPQEVGRIIKGEREIIESASQNLEWLTKDFRTATERFSIEHIESTANGWLETRLGNIEDMIWYAKNCRQWLPKSEFLNGELEIMKRAKVTFLEVLQHNAEIFEKTGFMASNMNKQSIDRLMDSFNLK